MIAARLRTDSTREPDPRLLRIAGQDVMLDVPLLELAPFENPHLPDLPLPTLQSPLGEMGEPIYRGEAPLGGRLRRVEASLGPEAYRVAIDGAGTFEVSRDGQSIVFLESMDLLVDLFVGPALSLALALSGTFGLHASAVAVEGGAVAFLGESGAGKSTLAFLLGQRLADDLLPVGRSNGRLAAFPRFPQLKIPPEEQPGLRHPEELPMRAIYWLAPPADRVEVQPLSAREAALTLVRHTVAARLFGPDLLAAHLGFCAQAAEDVRVAALVYRRHPGIGTAVRRAIAADMGL